MLINSFVSTPGFNGHCGQCDWSVWCSGQSIPADATGDVRVDSVETLVSDNLERRGEGGGGSWPPVRIVPSRLVVFLTHIRNLSLLAY